MEDERFRKNARREGSEDLRFEDLRSQRGGAEKAYFGADWCGLGVVSEKSAGAGDYED